MVLTAQVLIVVAAFQLFDCLQAAIIGALRGYKDTQFPMWLSISAYWLVALPVGYMLGEGLRVLTWSARIFCRPRDRAACGGLGGSLASQPSEPERSHDQTAFGVLVCARIFEPVTSHRVQTYRLDQCDHHGRRCFCEDFLSDVALADISKTIKARAASICLGVRIFHPFGRFSWRSDDALHGVGEGHGLFL